MEKGKLVRFIRLFFAAIGAAVVSSAFAGICGSLMLELTNFVLGNPTKFSTFSRIPWYEKLFFNPGFEWVFGLTILPNLPLLFLLTYRAEAAGFWGRYRSQFIMYGALYGLLIYLSGLSLLNLII